MTVPGFGRDRRGRRDLPPTNRRHVATAILRAISPPGPQLPFMLDPEQVQQSGGAGGWVEITHPKVTSSTEYEGMPLRQLTIPTLWDRWRDGGDVETELALLQRWARIEPGHREPAILRLVYGTYSHTDFVLNGLEWGAELRNSRGLRVRAEVTLTLLEHRDAAIALTPVQRVAAPVGATPAPGLPSSGPVPAPSGRVYVVTAADGRQGLSGIALRELGKASRWPEIARLNNLRDPDKIMVGQRLRLPA